MITSSPIDIEERSPTGYQITQDDANTYVVQKKRPFENIPTNRSKQEIITYLRELKSVIKTDDHQFVRLPPSHSKNEFDTFLTKVHNAVVNKLNNIPTAIRKQRYIDTYINGIRHPLFFAEGTKRKKRNKRKTRRQNTRHYNKRL
jgi:predicted metal-dependent hydrolase